MNRHVAGLIALLVMLAAAAGLFLIAEDAFGADVPLGLTDRTQTCQQIAAQGMRWTRIIADANMPREEVAQNIRDCHAAGLNVALTLGGIGTGYRYPSNPQAFWPDHIAYAKSLPRVELLSIGNEPDLDPQPACEYAKGWKSARRVFGKRLLFGEFSPHQPLTFTQAVVARCLVKLPKRLRISVHPYQNTDPQAPPAADSPWVEGGIGHLGWGKRWLRRNAGLRVTWVPTEFGYCTMMQGHPNGDVTDALAARLWPRALKRFAQLRVPLAILYVANGPSWRSSPFPAR